MSRATAGPAVSSEGEIRGRQMAVFLSYSDSRQDTVEHVARYLARHGVDTWYAPRDIPAGAVWDEAIYRAIRDSDALVLLFDSSADTSKHVKREISIADAAEIPIRWLRLENVQPQKLGYYLSSTQWIDWLDKRDDALERLSRSLPTRTPSIPASAQVPSTTEPAPAPTASAGPLPSLSQDTFLARIADAPFRAAMKDVFAACEKQGLVIFWGTGGVSLRLPTPDRAAPLSIGWAFPDGGSFHGAKYLSLGVHLAGLRQTPSVVDQVNHFVTTVGSIPGATTVRSKALDAYYFHPAIVHEVTPALVAALGSLATSVWGLRATTTV